MVGRKITWDKYIAAAVITAIIFMLGVAMGLVIENKRVDLLENIYKDHNIQLQSAQLQYEYISVNINKESCDFVFDTYHKSLEDLDDATVRLESYDSNERINEDQFNYLKREYLLAQIRYWLLASRIDSVCQVDMVPILYFFDKKENCPECDDQSFILTYLKKKFGQRALIFSISVANTNEPMVELLETRFKIRDTYPTVIVGNHKFQGFTDTGVLEDAICSSIAPGAEECT